MLELRKVTKQFAGRGRDVTAVDNVSLLLHKDEIFALIGESGSGKSTLAEMIVGLRQPTQGTIVWSDMGKENKADIDQQVQVIFQNPDRSLNPYWKVKDIVAEPLVLHGIARSKALERAEELLERVRLPSALLEHYPSECSGGQKQRIAIARALSLSPALLIADEITSALDPMTENEILQLLVSLRNERGMSILYITHRLETIEGFADRMAVMKDGVMVEMGDTENILRDPKSEYTRTLLAACSFS